MNGLLLLSDRPRAREMFDEAIKMAPANYLPYLFGSGVSKDPIGALERAVNRNRRSIASWLSLALEHGRNKNTERAMECFQAAANIFPGYEHPYIECANYLNGIGMTSEGASLLKTALGVIPEAIKSGCPPAIKSNR